eukprot:gnl/TRDRNA2_/TRDRNA2_156186_c0_seq1.p1 gnl/TRDRNA2_/TRDRNA2_156186_c0~~gnl/TRDRNA2_/TRDRNA2_156186_c0_seq1.p1  ORF type:complete len:423 (-),score=53.71 gnl/TRDRNA2_/TRDRNA2_156186_c0_seq1:32-1279(-)
MTRRVCVISSHIASLPCSTDSDQNIIDVPIDEDAAFQRYCEAGKVRAGALGNRGPIRFDADGRLAEDILAAYYRTGFYVLEGAVSKDELREIQSEFEEMMKNAPSPNAKSLQDKLGRPVKYPQAYAWGKPGADPMGGTNFGVYNFAGGETKGRYPMKMREPQPLPGAAKRHITNINHPLAWMDSTLRLYGHPQLLRVAEAINGPDFTPFTENLFCKPAGEGTSTAWHQDPSSAWDEAWSKPGFDVGTCGFSFHLALTDCTAENALWMIPGSAQCGRVDVKAMSVSAGGSDRLPGAVPIICKPGDVYIQNRLGLHCAFANTSREPRVTVQFGFNRRASVLGVRTKGYGGPMVDYDEAYIRERSKMIALAIDARRQKYPHEKPYVYLPFLGQEDEYRWHKRIKEDSYGQYWTKDIVI